MATDYFCYRDGTLYAEEVAVTTLAATYGTPSFVYSQTALTEQWRAFDNAFAQKPHLVCYAVKANANLALLNILARLGSGFDIVSGGELTRVLRAGGAPDKIVFSGVGKSVDEMRQALTVGIHCFNVESPSELQRLNQVAGSLGRRAPVALRVNPDVDAKTHPYIATGLKENKFGIDLSQALEIYTHAAALPHIQIVGIDCHIGSQLTAMTPFVDALQRILTIVEHLHTLGITLQHIDIGGGLGVRYRDETPPTPEAYAHAILQTMAATPYEILLEPGRAIVANAGLLLTRVHYLKHTPAKHFAIVDAAMNDLIRPVLYGAWQEIVPVQLRSDTTAQYYDIVGPICETGDFLGKNRCLTLCEGDLLAICSSGAYGFVMSSNYNTRPRAAEVMVNGGDYRLVRRRETVEDLLALESL